MKLGKKIRKESGGRVNGNANAAANRRAIQPSGFTPEVAKGEVLTPEHYESYSDAQLDATIRDSIASVRSSLRVAQRELRDRLLPALTAKKKRYSQPGRRKTIAGWPSWEEYLVSIGLKPDTVRGWFQSRAAKELAGLLTDGTSGEHPGGLSELGTRPDESNSDVLEKHNNVTPITKRRSEGETTTAPAVESESEAQHSGEASPMLHAEPSPPQSVSHTVGSEPCDEGVDADALITTHNPDKDAPEGRPVYRIALRVVGSKLASVLRDAKEHFGDNLLEVEKEAVLKTRADELNYAMGLVADAKSAVEELKTQIEEWQEKLPENLQAGQKGGELEECAEALDEVINRLEATESSAEEVQFPGMY